MNMDPQADSQISGGGMPQTTNRTKWPVNGGAISVQPGWFPGHSSAYIYINIGINEPGHVAPRNMSHPVHPVMAITGPSNNEYPGQFCIPQIGMPAHLDLKVGDNITIQVIETAQHGAALYSVGSPAHNSSTAWNKKLQGQDADVRFSSVSMSLSRSPKKSKKSPRVIATTALHLASIWSSPRLHSKALHRLPYRFQVRLCCLHCQHY
jgi:hypothetical protein